MKDYYCTIIILKIIKLIIEMLIIALLFISIELTLGKLKVIGPEELKY